VKSFVVGVHVSFICGPMRKVTVEDIISGLLENQKTILKWKISATRKRGFEAEIGDLYICENGVAT
jgi:hypothetical protein